MRKPCLRFSFLEQFVENEHEEFDERVRAAFTFLSVVEFLRQSLPKELQEWLDEDIFLRETELWNAMAGPVFKCDFLVNTS